MSNELQNNEYYLAGGLGTIQNANAGETRPIQSIFRGVDGNVTITISASSSAANSLSAPIPNQQKLLK